MSRQDPARFTLAAALALAICAGCAVSEPIDYDGIVRTRGTGAARIGRRRRIRIRRRRNRCLGRRWLDGGQRGNRDCGHLRHGWRGGNGKVNVTSGQAGDGSSIVTGGTGGDNGSGQAGTGGDSGSGGNTGFAGRGGSTGSAGRGGTTGSAGRGGTTGSAGRGGTHGIRRARRHRRFDGRQLGRRGHEPRRRRRGDVHRDLHDDPHRLLLRISCHNPGTASGVSFASQSSAYTAVSRRVTPGNGAGSAFYNTVNSGSMPRGAGQAISDEPRQDQGVDRRRRAQ